MSVEYDVLGEVEQLRAWVQSVPDEERYGEWESLYRHWNRVYQSILSFADQTDPGDWTQAQLMAAIYAVARDNEAKHLVSELGKSTQLLKRLAQAALACNEPDARWQLAEQLGCNGPLDDEKEKILLSYAMDEDEYVGRLALQSLAALGSKAVEELALLHWERTGATQEWARMMVLRCLSMVGSAKLEHLLRSAEGDARPHLSDFAQALRHELENKRKSPGPDFAGS